MARLIECDRCGESERILKRPPFATGLIDVGSDTRDITTPPGWLTLGTITFNPGNRTYAGDGMIEGGEFCAGCVKALKEWRKPTPKAKDERP